MLFVLNLLLITLMVDCICYFVLVVWLMICCLLLFGCDFWYLLGLVCCLCIRLLVLVCSCLFLC